MRADRIAPGFTLLELAITLAIAVTMLALAVPALGGHISRQRLAAVGHDLAADLMLARHEAAQRGQVVHVVLRAGKPWCWAVALGSGIDCADSPAHDPLLLKATHGQDQPGIELLDAEPFTIDPRGGMPLAASGHADFRAASGEQLRVQLTLLGRAGVCALSGSVPNVPRCAATPAPP